MNVSKLNTALSDFVKADGKAATSALAYMALAIGVVYSAPSHAEAASDLIEAICDATGSRGTATKDFPKGKANPNALKQNGFSGLAEAARLLKKVGDKLSDNGDVRTVIEGFLGVIQNPLHYREVRNADKRVRNAKDNKALRKALRAAKADYLAITYPDRPTSFNALRSALDKATASKKSQEVAAPAADADTGEGEGEGEISANAVFVAKADVLANATISELATALAAALAMADDTAKAEADAALTILFNAMTGAAEAPALAKAA